MLHILFYLGMDFERNSRDRRRQGEANGHIVGRVLSWNVHANLKKDQMDIYTLSLAILTVTTRSNLLSEISSFLAHTFRGKRGL